MTDTTRYTIEAVEHGCIVDTGQRTITSQQTAVGIVGALGSLEQFFVFDVSAIQGDVARAVLRLELEAYLSLASSETLTVSRAYIPSQGNLSHPVLNPATGQTFAPDIEKHTIYRRTTVQPSDAGQVITLTLLPQALYDIQTATNGRFAVGLTLVEPTGEKADPDHLRILRFHINPASRTPQLIVETRPVMGRGPQQQHYGLQYDIADAAIPTKLQNIVNSQATTLEAMLQSFKNSAHHVRGRNDLTQEQRATSLDKLAKETQGGLAALAQKHVLVEQRIGNVHANDGHTLALSPEHAELLQALERVNSILHANIALARQHLMTMINTQAD